MTTTGGRIYLAALAALSVIPLIRLIWWISAAVPFPYALDYNEGIVWKQMIEIIAGRGYAPLGEFPAIVFHYPPVFHLMMAGVAALGVDPLSAGRVVSVLATLGSTLILVRLAARILVDVPPVQRIAAMWATAVCFLGCEGVHPWAPLVRVDPLACFFALAGLGFAVWALERPRVIYWAALSFVLSVFTKQTSLVTAAAALLVLLYYRPSTALRGIGACIVLGSACLLALILLTDGEILRHIILYNINRFDVSRLIPNFLDGTGPVDRPLIILGIAGFLWTVAHERAAGGDRDASAPVIIRRMLIAFVVLATLSLITSAKYGSSSAYYMQWEAGLAVFSGLAVAGLITASCRNADRGRTAMALFLAAIPIALGLWVSVVRGPDHLGQLEIFREEDARLAPMLKQIPGPILSTEMALLLRTGHDVVWEPAIFSELAHAGVWDERILVRKIRNHEIAAVLSDGDRGYRWFDDQFNPAIIDAMDEALPRKVYVGMRVLHLPADQSEKTHQR